MRGQRGVLVVALVLLVSPAWPAAAQTLRQAVEAAWQLAPETVPAASGQAAAAAQQQVAGAWLAAAPSLTLAERSDRFDANTGRRIQELELALPLWRPGQRAARAALANADGELAAAELAEARWQLAGEVRAAVWSAALDRSAVDFSRQRLVVVERIGREVARHVDVGDLARADWLLVNGEQLVARAAVLEAERRAEASARHYRQLTGLAQWPLPARSLPSGAAANDDAAQAAAHPRLRRAETELRRAMRTGENSTASADEPFELNLGVERERERYGQPASDSLRLAIKIPFGGAAWNRPAQVAADAARRRAELQRGAVQRAVAAEVANARAGLAAVADALALAEQQQAAADEHARLLRQGFALGESGLAALLRAETALLDAQAGATRQKLLLGQAQSRLEHSLGALP